MKAWLFTMLNNIFMDRVRAGGRGQIITIEEDFAPEGFSIYEELSECSFVEDGNPESLFLQQILVDDILSAIDELPFEFKQALTLCDIEGFSYYEISEILEVPIGTVRSRIARARAILQKKLWGHAEEMGIVKNMKPKDKPGYQCTCGEENNYSEINEEINEEVQ
jgi:RNA polymerase sigma-70 factor (ECF subfamily)